MHAHKSRKDVSSSESEDSSNYFCHMYHNKGSRKNDNDEKRNVRSITVDVSSSFHSRQEGGGGRGNNIQDETNNTCKVAIIGGSMAGCLAGMALSSAWKNGTAMKNNRNNGNGNNGLNLAIDIFERSPSNELSDRGLGIGLPPPIFKTLVDKGWVDQDMRYIETLKRQSLLKDDEGEVNDGDEEKTARKYHGKVLYEPEMNIQLHNWGLLWQQFRQRIEDDDNIQYHTGVKVVSTTTDKNDDDDDDDDKTLLSWKDVGKKYNEGRLADSQSKSKLGERLGRAQVIDTPDWSTMGPPEFEEWLSAQVKDTGNYMYKNIRGGDCGE
mmetsp:Transcript_19407/g.46887  ORF Transcript_19407/g.46887 Transcript_19407/m.46887 type:complete len:324 (-) Transcript_19407:134-1105(-)